MHQILFTQDGEIARITLHRPESLNALTEQLFEELKSVLLSIGNETKVIIVSGSGRAFSAGVDLKSTGSEGFQKEGNFMKIGREVGNLLANMKQVTIAQVHGYCFTGALELMLFFDMAFCTENTQFGDTHAKFCIVPQWGMSQRLARRVGLAKAKELTFRALRIKGVEAERIGLVNRAFKEEELTNEVNAIASEILENSFEAIGVIKRLYNEGYETTLKEGIAIEEAADTKLVSADEYLAKFKK